MKSFQVKNNAASSNRPMILQPCRGINFFARTAGLRGAVLLALLLSGVQAAAIVVSAPNNGLSVRVDEATGNYEVVTRNPAWKFAGHFEVPIENVAVSRGGDSIGGFQQITFEWQSEQSPMRGRIRLYDQAPLVLICRHLQPGGG